MRDIGGEFLAVFADPLLLFLYPLHIFSIIQPTPMTFSLISSDTPPAAETLLASPPRSALLPKLCFRYRV